VGAGERVGREVNGWAWFLVGWFATNLLLYVALIGRTITYTKANAIVALFTYPALIYVVTRAVT
jgi:hypothetical protein